MSDAPGQQSAAADRLSGAYEEAPGASPAPDAAVHGVEDKLADWLSLGQRALVVSERLVTLLRLELSVAFADSKRLVIVLLCMVPLALFAWFGLGVLLAWVAFVASGSVGAGIAAFFALQLVCLYLLLRAAQRLQTSLGLPASRRQWQALMRMSKAENSTEKADT